MQLRPLCDSFNPLQFIGYELCTLNAQDIHSLRDLFYCFEFTFSFLSSSLGSAWHIFALRPCFFLLLLLYSVHVLLLLYPVNVLLLRRLHHHVACHVIHRSPCRHLPLPSPSSSIATTSNGGWIWRLGFASLVPFALSRVLKLGPALSSLWMLGNAVIYAISTPGWIWQLRGFDLVLRWNSSHIWRQLEMTPLLCGPS